MPKKRKDVSRNPYMYIARRIIQTDEERKADIKLMRADIKALKNGTKPTCVEHVADTIIGTDGKIYLNTEEKIEALERHIDDLQFYVDAVSDGIELMLSDVDDPDMRRIIKDCMMRMLGNYTEMPFHMLGYPLSRQDFEARRRTLLKYIIRIIGIMPYRNQPAFMFNGGFHKGQNNVIALRKGDLNE